VLDEWFEEEVRPRLKGQVSVVNINDVKSAIPDRLR
jgi:hypothetical protein